MKKTGLEVTVTGNGTSWTDEPVTSNPDATVTFHITAPKEGITITAIPNGSLTGSDGFYTLSGGNTVSITATSTYIQSIKGLCEIASDGKAYTLKSDLLITGYTLADARVGDFYCKSSDGSTGYLIPGDASLTTAQQAACIGIVYSTDAERIGEAATKFLLNKGITPHGLVMALTNASDGCRWGNEDKDENNSGNEGEPFKANTDQLNTMYANVDGYGETHWIIDTYRDSGSDLQNIYTAFYHANRYGTAESNTGKYTTPANTTGWFIPGMGQWWDILSNLGGMVDLDKYKARGDIDYFDIGYGGVIAVNRMNRYLLKISGATTFSIQTYFLSSSECNAENNCGVSFSTWGDLSLGLHNKNPSGSQGGVWCSLAF